MDHYRHSHAGGRDSQPVERRIRWVMGLTFSCMVAEILAGWQFGSLALLADGWHMASHGVAMVIALVAYAFARRYDSHPRFTFGTGKVDALAGYTSAILLGLVALTMAGEAFYRLWQPTTIAYGEAMVVAAIGLVVNLASALILEPPGHAHDHDHHDHDHGHDHAPHQGHGHAGHHHQHDHSLHATYLHVLADMLTSVGALVALAAGMLWSWNWLDPVMGLVGAVVITLWAKGLLHDTHQVLLDEAGDPALMDAIRQRIESDADNRVADLHLWSIRPGRLAVIISLVTHLPRAPEHYKALLADLPELAHVTIEVHGHGGEPCLPLTVAPGHPASA